MRKVTGIGGVFLNAKTQRRQQNGIKNTLDLIPIHMVRLLNGMKVLTIQQKLKHNGHHLPKTQNILTMDL